MITLSNSNELIDVIASVIHDERRLIVRNIVSESKSIERHVRNKYKLRDIEYKNLSEDDKEGLRISARRIIKTFMDYESELTHNL